MDNFVRGHVCYGGEGTYPIFLSLPSSDCNLCQGSKAIDITICPQHVKYLNELLDALGGLSYIFVTLDELRDDFEESFPELSPEVFNWFLRKIMDNE